MKLYNKSELRYSRIFFDKKPPAYIFILIILTALVLVSALIGSVYIPKNYIVKANGNVVITGTELLSSVKSGNIVTMHKCEGDTVKAGEVILTLSSGEERLQADSLMKQLDKLRAKEEIFQKYEQSLNDKVNHMSNSGEEQEYFGKVEYYLSQLNSESYNNGTQYFKLQDEYVKLNKLIGELEQLDNAHQTAQNELDQLHQQQVLSPPVSDSYTTNTNATEPSVPPMLYVKDNLETKKVN